MRGVAVDLLASSIVDLVEDLGLGVATDDLVQVSDLGSEVGDDGASTIFLLFCGFNEPPSVISAIDFLLQERDGGAVLLGGGLLNRGWLSHLDIFLVAVDLDEVFRDCWLLDDQLASGIVDTVEDLGLGVATDDLVQGLLVRLSDRQLDQVCGLEGLCQIGLGGD